MADLFHCSLVTPERVVLEAPARFVALPAYDGEIGFLAHRAPLLARLGSGELRVDGPQGRQSFFVSRGFAQMLGGRLTVLAEEARPRSELRRADGERDLQAALALPAGEESQVVAKERALLRARALLRLAAG